MLVHAADRQIGEHAHRQQHSGRDLVRQPAVAGIVPVGFTEGVADDRERDDLDLCSVIQFSLSSDK